MKRYLCIYLPFWPIELSRRKPPKQPDASPSKLPPESAAAADSDCLQYLKKLAQWSLKFTPLAGIDADLTKELRPAAFKDRSRLPEAQKRIGLYFGLVLDISGTERLYRNEQRLIGTILEQLSRAGFTGRAAAAPTIGAAWAFSRFGSDRVVQICSTSKQSLKGQLAELPAAALRISSETENALQELGIVRLQQLFALPTGSLLNRFGNRLLQRIDAACGMIDEPLQTIKPPVQITAVRRFEVPLCTHKSIQIFTLKLFKQILLQLQQRELLALSFLITFSGPPPAAVHKEIPLAAATHNLAQLHDAIGPIVESLTWQEKLADGICSIAVEVRHTVPAAAQQGSTAQGFESLNLIEAREGLLNSFVLRLGKTRVCRIEQFESYIPERAFKYAPIAERQETHSTLSPSIQAVVRERPPLLLSVPQPIAAAALLPDYPPALISINHRRYRIVAGSPPERIADEWWRTVLPPAALEFESDFSGRDYFKVQDHFGRWLWIFREQQTQNWFLHGVWC